MKKFIERRKHKRYAGAEDAIVRFSSRIGRIINISEGGMAIHLIDILESLPDELEATIFCSTTNTKIKGLALKIVRENETIFPKFAGFATRIIGVTFTNPNAIQQEQIRQHISRLS